MKTHLTYTLDFSQISLKSLPLVGGKNASLGELFNALKPKGIGVLDGFATTADAYRALLQERQLEYELRSLLSDFDVEDVNELSARGHAARVAVLDTPLPAELREAIITAYERLCKRLGREPELAVRSSATAEDLPEASFAGAAIMRRVAAIVTDQGGRTAHAAIVSREFGIPCIVGCGNATELLHDGDEVTVCCAEGSEGHVYAGRAEFEIEQIDAAAVPPTLTEVMLTIGDPAKAFQTSFIPNSGVGLARTEFIVTNHIGIHPMALARYPNLKDAGTVQQIAARIGSEEPREFFIRRFSEGVGRIAAAFYPKPVIVRTSDFKTNEYARLLGGAEFEPVEENPMLGFRGASRYYDERYADGFALECAALLRVRKDMGLTNVKIMIPFCRTVEEAKKVIDVMAQHGLKQGEHGLQIYGMCELPSNIVRAEEFLRVFDGYSIGSNDLTQLVLGIDRDSGTVAHLFDERDRAVMGMIAEVIGEARRAHKPIGICGQAPSDFPDFARWLVEQGITSISLNPDTAIKTTLVIANEEAKLHRFATAKA